MAQNLKSAQRIARSPDLAKLREEGYEIQLHASDYVLVKSVPYVNAAREVEYGTLIAPLILLPDGLAGKPYNHQMFFQGTMPHDAEGRTLESLGAQSGKYLSADLEAQFHFSVKPAKAGWVAYSDYYELITTYVGLIERFAQRIDSTVTAKTGRIDDYDSEDSVLAYPDTATTRAEIAVVSEKLASSRVAIIGLGGTGSYILDFLAKTWVREIRLYDGDRFSQHNAYRAPGAATRELIMGNPTPFKVDYFKGIYEKIHLKIVANAKMVTELGPEFNDIDFVFICIDRSAARATIVDGLTELGKPFIDVGMGIMMPETSLGGNIRITFSAPECRTHRYGMPLTDVNDEYATNIQIVELNALNAALAVIRWKKHLGFYRAGSPEYSSVYTTAFNSISNADQLAS